MQHIWHLVTLTPCALLLATHPLPNGWCPETSRAQQNNKIQAERTVSADTEPPHTSSGSRVMIERDYFWWSEAHLKIHTEMVHWPQYKRFCHGHHSPECRRKPVGRAEEDSPQASTSQSNGSGENLYGGMVSDSVPCVHRRHAWEEKTQSCCLGNKRLHKILHEGVPIIVAHIFLRKNICFKLRNCSFQLLLQLNMWIFWAKG